MMNERLVFGVFGSRSDVYEVTAWRTADGNLTITCTCPAGQNGLYCKHRFALLDGVIDDLAGDNAADVDRLRAMLPGSDVAAALDGVRTAETMVAEAKAALASAKKRLARAMHD